MFAQLEFRFDQNHIKGKCQKNLHLCQRLFLMQELNPFYLQLVDLTGRCIRTDKLGFIENTHCNILTRLNISPENWFELTTKFEYNFKNAVGTPNSLSKYCNNQKLKRRQGITQSMKLLDSA